MLHPATIKIKVKPIISIFRALTDLNIFVIWSVLLVTEMSKIVFIRKNQSWDLVVDL